MDMESITAQTPLREIEIFGIPALFAEQVIPPDTQIPGMYYYEIISGEDNETLLGTVLTVIPVEIPDEDGREIYDTDLVLVIEGEMLIPEELQKSNLAKYKWIACYLVLCYTRFALREFNYYSQSKNNNRS